MIFFYNLYCAAHHALIVSNYAVWGVIFKKNFLQVVIAA